MSRIKAASLLSGLIASFLGAQLFVYLELPLPWMLGPIISVAAMQIASARAVPPTPGLQYVAQIGLGVAIGLAFRPDVARMALAAWPSMLATVAGSIAIGGIGTLYFHRIVGLDLRTSYFSAVVGGAWEMYTLAERYGAKSDMVAAAHVLRISMVVLIVPNVFTLAGVQGYFEEGLGDHMPFSAAGLALLLGLATAAAYLATLQRIPNAFILGPLILTATLTGSGFELSSMPNPLVWGAQLLMGWSMGSKFSRQFFVDKPWFLASVAVYTLAALVVSACIGYVLSTVSHHHMASVILGTAPGGVAEMSLTAVALKLDVPLVTSLHLLRVISAALLVGLIYRVFVEPKTAFNRTGS